MVDSRFNANAWACITLASALLLSGCASVPASVSAPVLASSSSYECRPTPVPGLPMVGLGKYGCHFQLRDIETGEVLGNTDYSLDLFAVSPTSGRDRVPVVTLQGITDAHGRSGFMRSSAPITAESMRFVKVVGTGQLGSTPRLVRPTDGHGIAKALYHVQGCGFDLKGLTDEQGYTPLFATESECRLNGKFYGCKNEQCKSK